MNSIDDFRGATWQDVRDEVMTCWPSQYWGEHGDLTIEGWVLGIQNRGGTPALAMLGLRVSTAKRVPACGELIAQAREALGPPTAMEIAAAEQRQRELHAANATTRHLNAV
jgi:hypothetical protein